MLIFFVSGANAREEEEDTVISMLKFLKEVEGECQYII